jgi:hypothetical protein
MARPERPPKGLALRDDESVRVVVRPSRRARFARYLFTLGLYGLWRKRDTAVVTNRRILLGRGIVNREERSVPLARVNRAKFVRRGLNSYTEVEVSDGDRRFSERIGPLSSRTARRLQREILDQD